MDKYHHEFIVHADVSIFSISFLVFCYWQNRNEDSFDETLFQYKNDKIKFFIEDSISKMEQCLQFQYIFVEIDWHSCHVTGLEEEYATSDTSVA